MKKYGRKLAYIRNVVKFAAIAILMGGIPSIVQAAATTGNTVVLTHQDVNVSNNYFTDYGLTSNVSAAKEVRLNIGRGTCSPCSAIAVLVYSNNTPIDQYTIDVSQGGSTKVYEIPGTSLNVQFAAPSGGSNNITLTLLGRPN